MELLNLIPLLKDNLSHFLYLQPANDLRPTFQFNAGRFAYQLSDYVQEAEQLWIFKMQKIGNYRINYINLDIVKHQSTKY